MALYDCKCRNQPQPVLWSLTESDLRTLDRVCTPAADWNFHATKSEKLLEKVLDREHFHGSKEDVLSYLKVIRDERIVLENKKYYAGVMERMRESVPEGNLVDKLVYWETGCKISENPPQG